MNHAQAVTVATVLCRATHPSTCPITGQRYSDEELADFGEPRADGLSHSSYEMQVLDFALTLPGIGRRSHDLYVSEDGKLWQYDTIRIPAEDCDCECSPGRDSVPFGADRDHCPRHGKGICELECYRAVDSFGWQIADREYQISGHRAPYWTWVMVLGAPHRDVLSEYRAERAAAAGAAA